MSAKKPPDEKIGNIAPFGLRMLPDLRARIEQAAAESGRSLNAEIVHRLQNTLDMDDHFSRNIPPPDDALLSDPSLEFLRSMDERYKKILDEVQAINERYAADIKERHARSDTEAKAARKPKAGE